MQLSAVIIGALVYIVVVVLFAFFFIWFIHHYQDPEDLPDFFTKFVTWLTYTATTAVILALPFDVVCAPDSHKFMPIVWQVFMAAIVLMIVAVVPFTMCYYEQDGSIVKKVGTGICWMVLSVIVWALIIVILWATVGYAEIPVTQFSMYPTASLAIESANYNQIATIASAAGDTSKDITINVHASFVVYAVCMVSLLGWVFFLVFGGCGLFTLPFDWILSCLFRPRIPTQRQFAEFKAKLRRDCEELLRVIERKRKECTTRIASEDSSVKTWNRKERKELKHLREDVDDTFVQYDHVRYVTEKGGYNVLLPYLKFIGAIFFLFVAAFLVAQMVYVIITGEGYFVSDALVAMDDFFPFLGAGLYGVFVLYMGVATIKGSVKIGTKFLLVQFYPMKEKATLPNAMLFNGMLYMLASLALMQFANTIFSSYTYNSAIRGVFTGQIQNMRGIKYLFRYLHYAYLGAAFLGLVWSLTFQCCCAMQERRKKEKRLRVISHR